MGLDSFLFKMARFKDTTAKEISAIDSYCRWLKDRENPNYSKYSFKEWTGYDYSDLPDQEAIGFYRKLAKLDDVDGFCETGLMNEVGYWRKANHIHNWFVENVQNGIDDCKYHNEVTKELLEELYDICREVLDTPDIADQLLPRTSGFFFGSSDYDDWYMKDIEETMDIITQIFETTDFEKEMIYYVSSW